MKHFYERAPQIIISAALVLTALLLNCKATESVNSGAAMPGDVGMI